MKNKKFLILGIVVVVVTGVFALAVGIQNSDERNELVFDPQNGQEVNLLRLSEFQEVESGGATELNQPQNPVESDSITEGDALRQEIQSFYGSSDATVENLKIYGGGKWVAGVLLTESVTDGEFVVFERQTNNLVLIFAGTGYSVRELVESGVSRNIAEEIVNDEF